MIYKVHLLAFADGDIREVNVPDEEAAATLMGALESIFYYGQNDFQPVAGKPSVSMGDVAVVEGRYFLCKAVGWTEMTAEEFQSYVGTPRRERWNIYM